VYRIITVSDCYEYKAHTVQTNECMVQATQLTLPSTFSVTTQ
jgi:hypothetical protein